MAYFTEVYFLVPKGLSASVKVVRRSAISSLILLTEGGINISCYIFFFPFVDIRYSKMIKHVVYCFLECSPDGWSREGCHAVKSTSNAEETECSCNHLTHFAVLLDYSDANSKVS